MKIDDRIHSLTTIIDVTLDEGAVSRGTAFFFHVLAPRDPTKETELRQIHELWLVTNRHVLLPSETCPKSATFHLRTVDNSREITWLPITLDRQALQSRARVHADANVDVAVINVTADVVNVVKQSTPIKYSAVGEDDFPDTDKLSVEVTSDVIVVGYPKGFYDKFNKFPIVKAGIIASRWHAPFQGQPAFAIDAKLLPGSSGSLVISKPMNYVVKGGKAFVSNEKQFCFLGIFSGEPYELSKTPVETDEGIVFKKEFFNLGLVWYYSLIPEIIRDGVRIATASEGVTSHA
jgi:hypothetical protein